MEIESKEVGPCRVYTLEGNLEIYATDDLKVLIMAHLQQNPHPRVVIHMGGVDFVDSSGLGLLMHMQFRFKETRFRFCQVRENIRQAMDYTNLLSFFKLDNNEQDSLRLLQIPEPGEKAS